MRFAHARREARRAAIAVLSILLCPALPAAAAIPGETLAPDQLQQEIAGLLLGMDAAAAPRCGNRTLVKAELIRPPVPAASPREAGPAGPWQERWHLDRCGEAVAWDVWSTPTPGNGVLIGVGLAARGESAPAVRPSVGEAPPGSANASARQTFLVTNTSDSGPGSLTQAILDANASRNQDGPDLIRFEIPGPGPHSIGLLAALPAITDPVVIDGTLPREVGREALPTGSDPIPQVELDGSRLSQPAHGLLLRAGSSTVRGLRIYGFTGDGIRIEGGENNLVEGNVLGGGGGGGGEPTSGPPNARSGVAIVDSPGNVIGGSVPSARNVIAGNDGSGVRISGASSTGNAVLGNRIVRNGAEGIALEAEAPDFLREPGTGPNRFQKPPTLTSVTFPPARAGQAAEARVEGILEGEPSVRFRVELFATSSQSLVPRVGPTDPRRELLTRSEGDRLLAAAEVTTGADGRAGFLLRLPQGIHSRDSVTATATDPGGNSSEFSPPVDAPSLVINWNTGNGNWNNPANWSPAQLPAAGDDVVIGANGSNTTFTVTLDAAATVNSLNLGGGSGTQTLSIASPTLTLNGPSTVNANGTLSQSGGTIAGAGSLTINGTFNWSGGLMTGAGVTTVNGPFSLSGLVAINANRTLNNASTANWTSANGLGIRTGTGSVINNTGTWDAQTDGAAIVNYYGGATTFNNSGTFRKSAGTGTTSVTILFTSTGTVDVQSGTLSLGANGSSTGALNVSGASATLLFAAGVFDVHAGTTVSGPGTVLLNSSGTLNVNTAITIPAATTYTMQAGTLGGTGTLTLNGTFNWSGGLMTGAGVTTVNGPFQLSGLVAINANRTLNNASTANWTSASGLGIRTGTGSVINNTGTWDAQTDGAAIVNYYGGATTFNNSGTFRKSAGTGTTSVTIQFTHTGTVDVQNGTLSLGANGSSTGALNVSAATATLLFAAGVFDLNAGTSVSGPGTVLLNSSGTLNVNSALSVPAAATFTMLAGTLAGTGTLTANGTFNWSGGLMTGAGVTTLNGPLNLSGLVAINGGRTLNNTATASWTSANGLGMRTGTGSVINNTGTWDAQTDGAAIVNYYLGATSFNNSGTFKKSAGTGTTSISIAFTNTGTVDVQSGTLNVSGSSYKQTAGITRLTGGGLTSLQAMAIQGGTLAGAGTVTGPVVVSGTGLLAPGLSPGTLNLVGSYTQQGPGGAFHVEIGGTAPGSQYDTVNVSGAGSVATLAGVLNVSLVDSFVPAAGDSFTIMTYPSHTGTLTLNLPTLPCLGWKATYGATALVLTAFPLPTEVTGLAFPVTKVDMAWDSGVSGPTRTYDVVKGDLRQLPVGTGPNESCLAQAVSGTTASDPATPAPNRGFWYVVRERVAGCGIGTYGRASDGAERTSTACP